jgi:hypothetical protein
MDRKRFRMKPFVIIGIVSLFLCYSSVAEAKWYKDYAEAQETAERGDWEKTIELLLDAIKEEPEPQENKHTYGMYFIDYYPYLKLGEAYLQIGYGKAAQAACEKSKEKKVAPGEEVEQCLRRAEILIIAQKQSELTKLLPEEFIKSDQFACALKMLKSGEPVPLLEELLSDEISPEQFIQDFRCDPTTLIIVQQEKLTKLLPEEFIKSDQFACALKMLKSGEPAPLLEKLLSGEITPEKFTRDFTCDSE